MIAISRFFRRGGWPLLGPHLAAAAIGLFPPAGAAQTLQAHAEVSVSATNFAYTVFNDQPSGSRLSLGAFYLELNAPIEGILSPPGWTNDTDGFSYVAWMCANGTPPFANDISPGASLSGFVVQAAVSTSDSFNYDIVSSDIAATNAGPVLGGSVTAPALATLAPNLTLAQDNGVWNLSLTGVPGFFYTIESSSDLTNWISVSTNVAPCILPVPADHSQPATFYQAIFQTTQD